MKYLSVYIYHKYVCVFTTMYRYTCRYKEMYVYMTVFEYVLMTAELQL